MSRDRVENYLKAFGSTSVLLVEVKYKIGRGAERLNAIAQVIAECDACDYNNKLDGFDVPVIGILCDGTSFEFFSFSAKGKTYKFNCGCLPGDPIEYRCGLQLTDFTPDDSAARGRFVGQILFHKFDGDPICEIIFDLLMGAYVSSMTQKLFREQSESEKKLKGRKGRKVGFGELEPSSDRWDEALDYEEAFGKFRAAVKKKSEQAKILVEDAMNSLKLSIESLDLCKKNPITTDWDDAKIEEV